MGLLSRSGVGLTLGVAGFLAFVMDGGALAAGNVFTVGNYPVEAEAANAVAAKDKAIADGQEAAFRSLLKRIVPVTDYRQLDRLKALKAAEIVDGVSVRSERNSSTRYIASLDFSFQGEAVRETLTREAIPFVEQQAPEIVLVAVSEAAAPASAKDQTAAGFRPATGDWAEVWGGLDLTNTLTPVRLASLRSDIPPETITAAMAASPDAVASLAAVYQANDVVLAVAEVDSASKTVNVTLAGRDAVGPLSWKRSYRIHGGDTAYALELASVVSLGVLEGRWKALKTGGVSVAAMGGAAQALGSADPDLLVEVEFSSPDEWFDLRTRLLGLPGVDNVHIDNVTARSAQVALRYPAGGAALAEALAQDGVSLTPGPGAWTMRFR